MKHLSKQQCEACNANAHRLSASEINSFMTEVKGWELIQESNIEKLKRVFKTHDFNQSMDLANAIARLAEQDNHHPQIMVEYSSLTVLWWTHKIEGLHQNDFIMAAKTSLLYLQMER